MSDSTAYFSRDLLGPQRKSSCWAESRFPVGTLGCFLPTTSAWHAALQAELHRPARAIGCGLFGDGGGDDCAVLASADDDHFVVERERCCGARGLTSTALSYACSVRRDGIRSGHTVG